MRLFLTFFWLLGMLASVYGQEITEKITLNNASFEDIPRHSYPPRGWSDCGFPNESPPDIQPSGFNVNKKAYEGNTYLGMVVRDNDTWEAVSQRLSKPMQKGKCYEFSLFLARSELYVSQSHMTKLDANYITPAKLRIYGGFGYCDKQYLLAESSLIINTRWIEYTFKFEPIGDYTHIIFEAFYKTPTLFPYNGNVLLDNASEIKIIPCDEEVQIIAEETKEEPNDVIASNEPDNALNPKPNPNVAKELPKDYNIVEKNTSTEKEAALPVVEEGSIAGLKRSQLKKGQIIRIDKLFFEVDKADIQQSSFPELKELFQFLSINKDVAVEIGGHTNGVPTEHWYCDSLSNARAKAVADYLADMGIDSERLQYKGYGKRRPLYSNRTEYGRKKNQRVEIKILSMDETSQN